MRADSSLGSGRRSEEKETNETKNQYKGKQPAIIQDRDFPVFFFSFLFPRQKGRRNRTGIRLVRTEYSF